MHTHHEQRVSHIVSPRIIQAIALASLFAIGLAAAAIWLKPAPPAARQVADPQASFTVRVRANTQYGLPYGEAHVTGLSDIVWGEGTNNLALTVTLAQPGQADLVRTVTIPTHGNYAVSMDRLIQDGDTVIVSDGVISRTAFVPYLTYVADAETQTVQGIGPANIIITTMEGGEPHSMQIGFVNTTRWVTTTATGTFSVTINPGRFQPAQLGAFQYTTPQGAVVYKPLFVMDAFARGVSGDTWADVILGQPDFGQITLKQVSNARLFNPLGILVDRSAIPNRVYIYDGGNSRVLGLSSLGVVASGPDAGQPCTSQSDYNAPCQLNPAKPADLVIGQPNFTSSHCNGDSAYQLYPDVPPASAASLCGLREQQVSITEGGSGATMFVDAAGNLYVPDYFNNRILRYNKPFETDTVADAVWGQADFQGTHCNRGGGFIRISANSLCFSAPPGRGELEAGVALDADGNMWVADTWNNRVLRFPLDGATGLPAQTADIVLGQPNLTSASSGSLMNYMDKPSSVRVSASGTVYVADRLNNRVLAFDASHTSGMSAQRTVGSGWFVPSGLEIDGEGGLWVQNIATLRDVRFVNEVEERSVYIGEGSTFGSIGVDRDLNVLETGWQNMEVLHYTASENYATRRLIMQSDADKFNQAGAWGLRSGIGLEVTDSQLIYGDSTRIVFWNNPQSLTNGQPANGYVTVSGFESYQSGQLMGRMRKDSQNLLWVFKTVSGIPQLHAYTLPLVSGQQPTHILAGSLPVLGGGVLTVTNSFYLGGIAFQPGCSDCMWVSDEENHRVFRIRRYTSTPFVDMVLGQTNLVGVSCNQSLASPSSQSLCHPGGLAFDAAGNLWVADHNLEFDGNGRLLMFAADLLPINTGGLAQFGIAASRVLGRNGSFTANTCPPANVDPLCGPWEVAFNSAGNLVAGMNSYLGLRFPLVYRHPLTQSLPVKALGDLQSMPLSARFDAFDNLYVVDHNRNRILIYRDLGFAEATPTQTPTQTPISSATVTATATATAPSSATATSTATQAPTLQHTPTSTSTPTSTVTPPAFTSVTPTPVHTVAPTASATSTLTPTPSLRRKTFLPLALKSP